MTKKVATQMTRAEAKRLTAEVRGDAAALWSKLLRLYEGECWNALGFPNWPSYFEAEFGGGKAHAYRMLKAAQIHQEISLHVETRGATEAQMRALGKMPPETRRRVLELVNLKYVKGLKEVSTKVLDELAWEASGLQNRTLRPDNPAERRVIERLNAISRAASALSQEPIVVQDVLRAMSPEKAAEGLRGLARVQAQLDFARDVLAAQLEVAPVV